MNREEIANRIADEGWFPSSETEYVECDNGYNIVKVMFISDDDIDAYIAEENQCAAEEKADGEREERMLEEKLK